MSLRDRIEEVVEATIKRGTDCDAGPQCPKCLAAHVADAVIALGLRQDATEDWHGKVGRSYGTIS